MLVGFSIPIVLSIIWYFVPKHLLKSEMLFCAVFGAWFQLIVDSYLDLKYNFYGYYDKGLDLIYYITVSPMIMLYMLLYLNFFPFKRNWGMRILYVAGWIAFSVLFEWLMVHTNFFYYHHWKFWWSVLMYPFLFAIDAGALVLFRKWNKSAL